MKKKRSRSGIRRGLFEGRGKNVNQASPHLDGLRSESVSKMKQVVYMHKGQQIKHVVDEGGTVVIPDRDAVIELDGKRYKVLTGPQYTTGPAGALPVFTVFLELIS